MPKPLLQLLIALVILFWTWMGIAIQVPGYVWWDDNFPSDPAPIIALAFANVILPLGVVITILKAVWELAGVINAIITKAIR